MNLKSIIAERNAVSILALGQINFNAGLDMMARLRQDAAKRKELTEDGARGDTSVADEFAQYTPEVKQAAPLDVSATLVVASLILANEIQGENLDFLKRNIKTPRQVIEGQFDWMANKEAQARLAIAARMKVEVSVDKFLTQIKGHQSGNVADFVTEAQSAVLVNIKQMETRHLIHLIEENYHNKDWLTKLEDSAISLFEGAQKRIMDGKFADLPDELIDFAQAALAKRGK